MAAHGPKHPLDYATPRQRRRPRRLHLGFLVAGLSCLALAYVAGATASRHGSIVMPLLDPPPPGDPYWTRRAADEPWFFVGCCSTPVLAFAGVVLFALSFTVNRPTDVSPPTE